MKNKHWTEKHFERVEKAKNFPELLSVAYEILDSMPKPVTIISGPISTGGRGSVQENLAVMARAILRREWHGDNVFDQLPFEQKFGEFASKYDGCCMPILEDFFLPIFESGKIEKICFIPGWESSTGAKWEKEQAERLGIEMCFMHPDEKI